MRYRVIFNANNGEHLRINNYRTLAAARCCITKELNYGVKHLGWRIIKHDVRRNETYARVATQYGYAEYQTDVVYC